GGGGRAGTVPVEGRRARAGGSSAFTLASAGALPPCYRRAVFSGERRGRRDGSLAATPHRRGYVAAAFGAVGGAAVLAAIGLYVSSVFVRAEAGLGGLAVLAGGLFGGAWAGAAAGCWVLLRLRGHRRAGVTGLTVLAVAPALVLAARGVSAELYGWLFFSSPLGLLLLVPGSALASRALVVRSTA
ncbi:MAG TPA: hypothetical protein VG452_08645, partial [Egibacteraceae bacterium]|nr:hypothetical protein [Egibacteraceae bacterium]